MERFESKFPIHARQREIREILRFTTHAQSCQIISVPGAGRSTVLRLLAYHRKLREYHLKIEEPKYLFIYANFAEVPSFDIVELNKFLFLSILAGIENRDIHNNVSELFKEALALADSQVLFQNLKKAVELVILEGATPIFLFDRFSDFVRNIGNEFFSNLRTLRAASGGLLAVVFSTHRPLEDLLTAETYRDFYATFSGNHIYLTMYDEVANEFRIKVLEEEYGKKLTPTVRRQLVSLTGGHGKLMKLSTQLLLSEEVPEKTQIVDFLLSHTLIKASLLEVWQSLTGQERASNLFPLLDEFRKRKMAEDILPKTIRLDKKREIYFGDEPLVGLTAYEFRLVFYFIENPNRVLGRDEVIEAVWQESKTKMGVSDEALDQMVHRLRRKIEDEADNPKHILTVKGRGFRFIP